MKKTAIAFASLVLVAGVVGCNNKNKTAKKNEGGNITDVAPPAPMHQPVAYQQQPQQAPAYHTPVTPVNYEPMPEPVTASTPAASGNRKYTVQKGDTLWGIAQKTYGDGKQYRKIVSANPNIKGEKVMAGQTILLP